MKSRILRRAGALLLALTLACSLLVIPAAADTPVSSISLNVADYHFSAIGQTYQLSATIQPQDATNQALEQSSDNPPVATVSNTGLITSIAPGSATITVRAQGGSGVQASCTVDVPDSTSTPPAVTGVTVTPPTASVAAGGSTNLSASVQPNGADQSVRWSVSPSSSPVTVSSSGFVSVPSGTPAGTVTIRATSDADNTKSGTCTLTVTASSVTPPSSSISLTLDRTSLSLAPGESATLASEVTGSTNQYVTWRSENDALVQVNTNGKVTVSPNAPVGRTVTITAVAAADPRATAFCVVSIVEARPPKVTNVAITSPGTDDFKFVDPGKTFQLKATVTPSDALEEDKTITWTSSDTSVATVSQDGTVKGVSPGPAVIRAQAGGSDGPTAVREIEVSGLLLSYVKKSTSGGKGETVKLSESSVVDIYQYRDISVIPDAYGNAKYKTINWESSNNSVAQVISGRVTGNYPGTGAVIKAAVAGTSYSASFKVNVSEDVAQAITINMGSEPSYSFSGLLSQLNSRSQEKAGGPLDNVYNLKVSTENGVLYYKYTAPETPGHGVGGTERYYYQPTGQGQMALRDVTFVPLPGFDGTAVVDYNAISTNGTTFTGTIRIEATATGDVSYSTTVDQPVSFSAEHFSAVCKGRTGRSIRYVTFGLPSSSRGTLYYNYSPTGEYSPKVDSNTRYYASSRPFLDDITFVPAKGYVGDVDIPYRCTDSSGASYSGTVRIRVYGANGEGSSNVEYSTGRNQRRGLSASDFNAACQSATNGTLNYIRFTSLPASSAGTLYLNYRNSSSTKVTTGRNYYRNSTPRISNITFVPASNYRGTVTIPFTGTSTTGATFSGDLILHVDDGAGTVHYNTPKGQAVTFAAGDFNDAGQDITGRTLDHIRFTSLPSSSAGILYYNYHSSSSYRASTGTDYYRSSSPSISNLTFVPASGYTGTVSIPFTGYDADSIRFNGTVTISVGGGGSQIVSYNAAANGFVRFNAADFNSACRSATGDTLNYVRFDLPSSQYGTLYHQYNSASRTGNTVGSSTGYYYSNNSRLLGDVSFAASSISGTVTFGFTGYSTRGDSFNGTVEITITGSTSTGSLIRYTGSSAHPISFRAADFQSACQAALGTQLSYVQFNSLPYTGHLYQNYSGPARTGTGVNTTAHYSSQQLSQISYLPKAEFQGTLTIPYTAVDTQGGTHSSTVELQLSNGYCAATFADTAGGWDWAKPSIEFLRSSGITAGYSNNTYRPGQSISRGEFTLMICRAFQFSTGGSSGFPDVPANSTYAGAVAAARDLGIVQGNNGRFQPDRPITRQSAMTMICRALEAAGQSLPAADAGLLSSYADGYQVSAFARPSVAALVQMGAVRGNSASRLNPGAAISRAEMAVILHRVLTR